MPGPTNALEVDSGLVHVPKRAEDAETGDLLDQAAADVLNIFGGGLAAKPDAQGRVGPFEIDANHLQHVRGLERLGSARGPRRHRDVRNAHN